MVKVKLVVRYLPLQSGGLCDQDPFDKHDVLTVNLPEVKTYPVIQV